MGRAENGFDRSDVDNLVCYHQGFIDDGRSTAAKSVNPIFAQAFLVRLPGEG